MRRQSMTMTRVTLALILAGLCVCALSIHSLGSGQALTGWAVPVGTEPKLGTIFWGIYGDFAPPYTTAKEGYCFIHLNLQVQNTSPEIHESLFTHMQLRDEDGYIYSLALTDAIGDPLLPGGVLFCRVVFEVPIGTVPISIIINPVFSDTMPTERISVMSAVPQELLRQQFSYLQSSNAASFCALRWLIDSATCDKDNAELDLVIAVENETNSILNNQEIVIPFLKDVFGRFSFPIGGVKGFFTRIPRDLRPGEHCKVRLTFDIASLEPPVYFFISKGALPEYIEKVVWLVIVD